MTEEHKMYVVEDEPAEKYGEVHYIDTVVEKSANNDAFARAASEIKNLKGVNTNFKRRATRVTNEMRKSFQNTDATAGTKQIEIEPDVIGYNIFDVVLPPHNLDYLAKLYITSPTHYAAVNAKVANIVGLGFKLVETDKTQRNFESISDNAAKTKRTRQRLEQLRDDLTEQLESFNVEDTFTEVLIKVWRDYEATGNGYIEVGRKKDGTIGYVGHIPAQTMRIRKKRDGFVQISNYKVQFFANFGDRRATNPVGTGTPNEVIHLKKYSPTNSFYGVPDIIAAQNAVAGYEFASRFNLDYFENKAVPRHLIILKGAKLDPGHSARLLEFFETGLKGKNHRSLYIPLPSGDKDNPVDLKIEPVEAGIQDASFNNYRKANIADILMVHRVPITKVSVSEGATLAIAQDADKTFKEQVCLPEQRILEKKLNKIVKELTDAVELKLNEMTLTDAKTQSDIDTAMVKAGIWVPNEPRARDGMPNIEGGDKRVDLNAKTAPSVQGAADIATNNTAQRERDAQRAANPSDSAGVARNPKGAGRKTP